jgi:hypothetical protein
MSGLVFEPIDLPLDGTGERTVTFESSSRPGRRRTIVAVGVAVAVVMAVLAVGRNGGGVAAPPTTTVATTATPTSTAGPPRRAGPGYTEDRAFLNFLGAQSGARLYGVTTDGSVVRIDLDGGVVTQRRLRRTDQGRSPAIIFARAGGAVVVAQNQAIAVGDGPDGVVTFLAARDTEVFPALSDSEVWLVHTAGTAGRIAERRSVHDGTVNGTIPDLPAGEVLGDDGTGALLIQTAAGVARIDESGEPPQLVTADMLVAWSAATLVVQRCDDRFECGWEAVDRATGERRSLGAAPWGGSVLGPALSPDGSHLVYVGGIGGPTEPAVEVMDLTTGARLVLDHTAALLSSPQPGHGFVWSADGRWLFWVTGAGTLRAWHVGDDAPITVRGSGHIPDLAAIGLAR